jgi:HAD superfamily hydrolase (TIGR01549 family)
MFGHKVPANISDLLNDLRAHLHGLDGARYSLELLAAALYERLGLPARREEELLVADALGGPRYRGWLWDGVAEALAEFHKSGIRMGVIADTDWTSRMMRRAFAGVGLGEFFGPVVCSCDLGIRKPDGRIFATALADIGAKAGFRKRILYVGDNLEKDIGGATAFGWDAALHVTSHGGSDGKAVLDFTDYRDLVKLVLS